LLKRISYSSLGPQVFVVVREPGVVVEARNPVDYVKGDKIGNLYARYPERRRNGVGGRGRDVRAGALAVKGHVVFPAVEIPAGADFNLYGD